MSPSKIDRQTDSRESPNLSTIIHSQSSDLSDLIPYPKPVSFMQKLSAEYANQEATKEAVKSFYKERKEAIKHAEWQVESKSNELKESIKRLISEYESLKQSQVQKIKSMECQIEVLKESCEYIDMARRKDVILLKVFRKTYQDYPDRPARETADIQGSIISTTCSESTFSNFDY